MKQLEKIEDYLTIEEEKELNADEEEIIKFGNLVLENAKKAGEKLDKVKTRGLWKKKRRDNSSPSFSDFYEYAKFKFGRGKTMSLNYIHIARIMNAMEEEGFDYLELGSIQNAMAVYFELKRLGYYNNGKLHQLFREVLKKGMLLVENISAIDESGEIIITPESITAAFQTIQEISQSGAYEIEGQQFPIKLGEIAVDEQASQILYENLQRRRQASAELINNNKKKRFQPKIYAINPTQPQEIKKEVLLQCPEHGKVSAISLVNAGVKLSCECYGIIEVEGDNSKLVYYKEEQL